MIYFYSSEKSSLHKKESEFDGSSTEKLNLMWKFSTFWIDSRIWVIFLRREYRKQIGITNLPIFWVKHCNFIL